MLKTLQTIDYPKELIELLLKIKTGALAANVIAPILIVVILKDFVPMPILFGWLILQFTVFVFRMIIARKSLNILAGAERDTVNRMLKYYLLMIFATSLFLGVIALPAILYAGELQVFMLTFIISAIVAGAMSTLSPVFHAVFIFVTVTLSIFIFSLLLVGNTANYYLIALLLVLYIIVTLPASFNIFTSLSQGIEQREKLEEKNSNFRNLLDSTMESIIIHDENRKIIDINQSGVRLFKVNDKAEVSGRRITDFVPEYELAKLQDAIQHKSNEPYEIDLKKSDGEIFPALTSGRNMIIEGKQVRIGTVLDLTQIKQKDQLLFQQSRQAAMGEMIGHIAHQWRQPLNALGLLLQNIYYSYESGELDKEQLERSMEKGQMLMQNMSNTIDDFRNFFKPNKEVKHFRLSEAINSAADLVSASYKNNNIDLELTLDDELMLDGYPNEFAQVLLNILSNAKDALHSKGIRDAHVRIKSYNMDETVMVEIDDNAGGIDNAIIKKIFEPYFTTKLQDAGTGIGLYMSKMIIENNMHGKITAANTEYGAKFIISMPFEGKKKC